MVPSLTSVFNLFICEINIQMQPTVVGRISHLAVYQGYGYLSAINTVINGPGASTICHPITFKNGYITLLKQLQLLPSLHLLWQQVWHPCII